MRAANVVCDGDSARLSGIRRSSCGYTRLDDDILDMPILPSYTTATEVTVFDTRLNTLQAPPMQSRPPDCLYTRIDFLAEDEDAGTRWWAELKARSVRLRHSSSRLRLMLDLTLTDAASRKGTYLLSFCSVCVVVCVCVIMLTLLASFAVVGLRLAEATRGPVDLELRPGGLASQAASLNYTRVARILSAMPLPYQAHSYRIDLAGTARKQASCTPPDGALESLWYAPPNRTSLQSDSDSADSTSTARVLCQESCLADYCNEGAESVAVVALDPSTDPALKTDAAAVRAGLALASLPYGSVALSASLADALDLTAGDRLLVTATADTALRHVFQRVENYRTANPHLLLSLRVGTIIDDEVFPDSSGNHFILVPPAHFTALVVDALAPSVPTAARTAARLAIPAEYASRIVFQMPEKQRMRAYTQTAYPALRASVLEWGGAITEQLGAQQISVTTPLLSTLYTMQFFSSFVGVLISVIILALGVVSAILIQTLLSVGLETKAYELGIQRMLGFTRTHLVLLVFTNTYFFTLPAWLAGLISGQVGYWIVRAVVLRYAAIPLGLGVSGSAVGWATLVGLGLPCVAALLPIRSLISATLPEALDTTRGRGSGVVYRIQRGRSHETDVLISGLGLLGALCGFCLYVFFPMSLITLNFALLFFMLLGVLLGMLGGLVLLATNFQRVMETVLMYGCLFFEAPAVRNMVAKSLSAHRRRNRHTSVMYALCVGFVVFLSVAFNIEVLTLRSSNERNRGGHVTLYLQNPERPTVGASPAFAEVTMTGDDGTTYRYEPTPLHFENALGMVSDANGFYFKDYIELERDLVATFGADVIPSMTYRVQSPTSRNVFPVQGFRLSTVGQRARFVPSIGVIPPNFFDVVNGEYVKVNEYDTSVGRYGLSEALYAHPEEHRAIIATTTYRNFALRNVTDRFLVETRVLDFGRDVGNTSATLTAPQTHVRRKVGQAVAVMDSSPVFLMTKYPNKEGEVLLSIPTAVALSGVPYMSCNVLALSAVYLQVESPSRYSEVEAFLRQWLSAREFRYSLRDLTGTTADIDTVDTIFTVLFVATQVVMMLVCFASLMSSMTANVLESAKEIGVLLCLGMSHAMVYRVYVWEAFLLVVSSGFLGLLVGMALAETMLLQSALFNQLSIPFPFPYTQLCIVLAAGVVSALASSVSPVTYLLRLPSITHILRKVV